MVDGAEIWETNVFPLFAIAYYCYSFITPFLHVFSESAFFPKNYQLSAKSLTFNWPHVRNAWWKNFKKCFSSTSHVVCLIPRYYTVKCEYIDIKWRWRSNGKRFLRVVFWFWNILTHFWVQPPFKYISNWDAYVWGSKLPKNKQFVKRQDRGNSKRTSPR